MTHSTPTSTVEILVAEPTDAELVDEDDDFHGGTHSYSRIVKEQQAKAGARSADKWSTARRTAGRVGFSAARKVAQVGGHASTIAAAAGAGAGALAPVTLVAGPVGLVLMALSCAKSVHSANKTYFHIMNLQRIHQSAEAAGADQTTLDSIAYTIAQKNRKLKRKGFGAIPVLGAIGNTVYTAGRRMTKKNRGVDRRHHAEVLWLNALGGEKFARMACEELLGKNTYAKIKDYDDGYEVLKFKLKSL